eukprot:1792099-Prymnesium_polylepis.1
MGLYAWCAAPRARAIGAQLDMLLPSFRFSVTTFESPPAWPERETRSRCWPDTCPVSRPPRSPGPGLEARYT